MEKYETPSDPAAVVRRFNRCIDRKDLSGLWDVMSDDPTLIDSAGNILRGKADCIKAWKDFFALWPDYRNVFDEVADRGGGRIAVRGHSVCSDRCLNIPALWSVQVTRSKVSLWRVYLDTGENRRVLGFPPQ